MACFLNEVPSPYILYGYDERGKTILGTNAGKRPVPRFVLLQEVVRWGVPFGVFVSLGPIIT